MREATPFHEFTNQELHYLAYESETYERYRDHPDQEMVERLRMRGLAAAAELRRRHSGGVVVKPAAVQRSLFPWLRRV